MATIIGSITRQATRRPDEPLNILTFPTHESFETNLSKTTHNFYAVRAPGIKNWETKYRPLPPNYTLFNTNLGDDQIFTDIDIDCVLSQNKFGQFQIANNIARQLHVPLISLEHTEPVPNWHPGFLEQLRNMRGDYNVFITEYSREKWGWKPEDAEVIFHGVDTHTFCPDKSVPQEHRIISVVNDWVNRDWCCFVAGTRIPTYAGNILDIEEIEKEDILFAGHARFINRLIRREYTGHLITLHFGYGNSHSVTPEHPFVLHNNKEVLANNLVVDDKIQVRFPAKPANIDLTSTLEGKYEIINGYIRCRGNHSCSGAKQTIVVDDQFLHFVGWYLAEGSVTRRNIEFDLSSSEQHVALKLIEYGKRIGINGFTRPNSRGDSIRVIFSSKPLAQYLSKTFGSNSHDKKIPAYLMSKECMVLFKELICGDGSKNLKRIKFDSASRQLVESVFMFFSQFGVVGHLSDRTREGFGVESDLFTVTYYGTRAQVITDDILTYNRMPVVGITITNISNKYVENLPVYNFSVNEDNLYMTLYGLTHNCGFSLWQTTTQGLPVFPVGDTPGLSKPASSTQELVNMLRGSKIFYNTSLASPIPMSVLEAMAAGCAIVSTATSQIPKFITHNVNGLLSNDPAELRKFLELLLTDDELRKKLGMAARQTVLDNYSIEMFVQNWQQKIFSKIRDYVFKG